MKRMVVVVLLAFVTVWTLFCFPSWEEQAKQNRERLEAVINSGNKSNQKQNNSSSNSTLQGIYSETLRCYNSWTGENSSATSERLCSYIYNGGYVKNLSIKEFRTLWKQSVSQVKSGESRGVTLCCIDRVNVIAYDSNCITITDGDYDLKILAASDCGKFPDFGEYSKKTEV